MKKFILPLLLLFAFGMLAAVESAPSDVVGYVKYDCVAGLNFVALPMEAGYAMASDLGNAYMGMMDTINMWDNATQSWIAANDLGFMWDGDFPVQAGSVIMVSALGTFSLYSIGDMPAANASYGFVPGLNTMMLPLNKSMFTMAGEVGDNIAALDVINYWDNATQSWIAANNLGFMWDGDFPISIGMPLMVSSFDTLTWPAGPRSTVIRNSK